MRVLPELRSRSRSRNSSKWRRHELTRGKLLEQLLQCLPAMADFIFKRRVKRCCGTALLGQIKIGVIPEAVCALWLIDNLAKPVCLGNNRLRVVVTPDQHQYCNVPSAAVALPLQRAHQLLIVGGITARTVFSFSIPSRMNTGLRVERCDAQSRIIC